MLVRLLHCHGILGNISESLLMFFYQELGDRHPKVQDGVILKDCASVLGNISVGTGAVVMPKAIVTKPVPPLTIMSGVPAKAVGTRTLTREAFSDDLEEHLAFKYLDEWREFLQKPREAESIANTTI